MSQFELSRRAKVSQSYVSRIERGERPLTEPLAEKLSKVLGGTAKDWLFVFKQTDRKSNTSLSEYVSRFIEDESPSEKEFWGTQVRQLRKQQIIDLFGKSNNGEITLGGVCENCEIDGFDESKVYETSYDTTIGSYAVEKDESGDWNLIETNSAIVIEPMSNLIVGVRQFITFPSWLEAEFSPASNIALKPLQVTNGPVINPKWEGILHVPVFNPTNESIEISQTESFLTLRFWVTETDGSQIG